MDQILALQYRRRFKRLQMIVLPYSFNVSGACLIRFSHANDTPDPTKGWRVIGIVGMRLTLKINGMDDFVADAAMKEVFESPWMSPDRLRVEAQGLVDTSSWDFTDLIADRVPRELVTRIAEQVDNWA
ncbi:hypothetical protein SEA_CECE_210 [Microbacterium phage Cece]|nr:hypothetical protein SEA_CECE_210 [Microbacterium phage Cece]